MELRGKIKQAAEAEQNLEKQTLSLVLFFSPFTLMGCSDPISVSQEDSKQKTVKEGVAV